MAFDRKAIYIAVLMAAVPLLVISQTIGSASISLPPNEAEYNEGDYIPLYVNKLTPNGSNCEAYSYFELPFCPRGDKIPVRKKSLEEIVAGDCFTNTQYELSFKVGVTDRVLCWKYLNKTEVSRFRNAVSRGFKYDMYYNNVGFEGVMGKVETEPGSASKYYLVRHINFYPQYMRSRVTGIHSSSNFESAIDITEDVDIDIIFTYSVFWKESSLFQRDKSSVVKEKDGYKDAVNLIYIISVWLLWLWHIPLAYLHSYFQRYPQGTRRSNAIHGEGCQCPPYTSLLSAVVGAGTKILLIIFSLLVAAYNDYLSRCWNERLLAVLFVLYCLGSYISGYTAISVHTRFTERGLKECLVQTGIVYLFPAFLTYLVVNIGSKLLFKFSDLPQFDKRVAIAIIWGFGTILCLSLGGAVASHTGDQAEPQIDCITRVQKIGTARQKKQRPRRGDLTLQMESQISLSTRIRYDLLVGLPPFLTVFMHMNGLYASLWHYKVCGVFQNALFVFIMLFIMTSMMAFFATMYQLTQVDLHWWWSSILRGGSTAIYMYAYGIYFFYRMNVSSYARWAYFLTYNFCIFYAVFLALGALSFCIADIVHCHTIRSHLYAKLPEEDIEDKES